MGNGVEAEPGAGLPAGVHYVDTQEQLAALVERVHRVRREAECFRSCLDTEADSLHHYQEKLCLIQLAFGDEFALVDPLAIADMSPLIEALDEGEVWFHGADYDLTLLKRTYGWTPRHVRDTQIAARLTGSRQFGLAALIESHFQKTLSKASQKADWSKRPLSTTMLHYAVDDVRYLLELADILQGQLGAKARIPWFLQGCDALRDGVASRPTTPKEDPWRIQGSGKLHGRGLAVLKELWTWRDKIAQERDVPCFRVISNKQILDVAIAVERGVDVHPPAGWRPKWKRDFELILQTVSEGSEESWPQRLRPKGARLSDAARDQLDRLCQLRETLAAELDLEPALLGGRSVLEGVVATAEGVEDLLPWQREVLGDHLVKAREALGFVITEA